MSQFFTVQLKHPYMTTGKTIALTGQTFVGKVMSLLFNMLSRLVITFLLRSKQVSIIIIVVIVVIIIIIFIIWFFYISIPKLFKCHLLREAFPSYLI